MRFENIEEGNIIYYAEIKNSQLQDENIKAIKVTRILNKFSIGCKEIYLSDGTMIMPESGESYFVKDVCSLEKLDEPSNFTIYGCTKEICLAAVKRLVSIKFEKICKAYNGLSEQMTRFCFLNNSLRELEEYKPKELVLEPVYTD